MSASCSLQLEVSWVPWTVREGRPKSTPGCQNTEALPHLPDDDLDCGDGNFCCYYRCRKCLYELALDNLKLSENLPGLRILPEISCIQPKKETALFDTDYGYHGEVAEFFINYLSRMDQLHGVAINSWSNCEARQILTNVDKTFDGTKYRGSSDFEIDWLIFTQSILAVIEVGMRCESEPTEEKGKDSKKKCESERQQNLIKKKIDQVLKDQVIVNHLMEATGCYNLTILYLVVFPNLPLEEVEKSIYIYKSSLEALLTPNSSRPGLRVQFGVVTSDAIPGKIFHLYDNVDGRFSKEVLFESVVQSAPTGSHEYMMSVVVTSMLLTGLADRGKKKAKETGENILRTPSEVFKRVEWDEKWQKSVARQQALGFPLKQRKGDKIIRFPKELILGPEQLEAIRSRTNHTVILGEAGSGKTTVLLALLYMNAGNYVPTKKLRKVYFIIPKHKTELRQDLEIFMEENCQTEWVQLENLENISGIPFCSENIYLIDEFYGCHDFDVSFPAWAKIWLSSTSVDSDLLSDPNVFPSWNEVNVFYFTRLFRSAVMISKLCAKIRRLIDQIHPNAESVTRLPWAMSCSDGRGPTNQNSICLETYGDNLDQVWEKIRVESVGMEDKQLAVFWNPAATFTVIQRNADKNLNARIIYLKKANLAVDDLIYTGSEFEKVFLILGEKIDPDSESCLQLLYNTISRAIQNVYIFCLELHYKQVRSLITFSEADIIFDKLRQGDNIGETLFSQLLSDRQEKVEALKRLLFSKHPAHIGISDEAFLYLLQTTKNPLERLSEDPLKYKLYRTSAERGGEERLLHPFDPKNKKFTHLSQCLCGIIKENNVWLGFHRVLKKVLQWMPVLLQLFAEDILSLFDRDEDFPHEPKPLFVQFMLSFATGNVDNIPSRLVRGVMDLTGRKHLANPVATGTALNSACTFLLSAIRRQKSDEEEYMDSACLYIFTAILYWDQKELVNFLRKNPFHAEKSKNLSNIAFFLRRVFNNKSSGIFNTFLEVLLEPCLKLSDKRLLDSNKMNILMHCTRSTEHFYVVLERARDQNDLTVLLTQRDADGFTCFMKACLYGNLKVVKLLIESMDYHWEPQNELDLSGNSVITILSREGHTHIVRYLFERVKSQALEASKIINPKGQSFLSQICSKSNADVLGVIVPFLPEIFQLPFSGKHVVDCLSLASKSKTRKNHSVLKELFAFLAYEIEGKDLKWNDQSLRGSNGENILMIATTCPETLETILTSANAQNVLSDLLAGKDSNGDSCLRWACQSGNLDSVKLLINEYSLDWKSDINSKGATLIHDLCGAGFVEILEYLYQSCGEDFIEVAKFLDQEGKSCLYYTCCRSSSVQVINLLSEVLNEILPIKDNFSHFIECLLAAKNLELENKDEILEVLTKSFNDAILTNYESVDDIFEHYRSLTADDIDLD